MESVHERPFLRWVARRWPDLALDLARRVHVTVRIQGRVRHGEFDRARPQLRQAKWRQFRERFGPLLPGVDFADFNDLESVARAVTDQTCAILVEPLQAEGGIHAATPKFLRGLRRLCDERGLLLVFDEIQVGMGRTGWLWAHQYYQVEPDIMAVAKALGGGLPLGVTLMREQVAQAIKPGDHASTFGANPVACAVGAVVLPLIILLGR